MQAVKSNPHEALVQLYSGNLEIYLNKLLSPHALALAASIQDDNTDRKEGARLFIDAFFPALVQDLLDLAADALANRQWSRAMFLVDSLLTLEPENEQALALQEKTATGALKQARSAWKMGKPRPALRSAQHALKLNPQDVEARFIADMARVKYKENTRKRIATALALIFFSLIFIIVRETFYPRFLHTRMEEIDIKARLLPSYGMEMVFVPAGNFLMGSRLLDAGAGKGERPRHAVHLKSFWIDRIEVTNEMYAGFLNAMGNQREMGVTWLDAEDISAQIHQADDIWEPDPGYANHPVIEITWYGARAYCEWAERRLPTEAEWEKAARGTDGRKYPWGEDINCDRTQYSACSSHSIPSGSLPEGASPYGALDMAGNVWEWVADWYDADYYQRSARYNPEGPYTGVNRVIRGGSWRQFSRGVRSAYRGRNGPYGSYFNIGFRCASSIPPPGVINALY